MKDMCLADVILEVKILRTSDGLILSQSHYMDKIREKFIKNNSDISKTLEDTNLHLSKDKENGVFNWNIS